VSRSLYTARVERGADSPDSSSPAGQKAVEQMLPSNVLISPRHYDQWGVERVKKIADAFVRTVESQRDVGYDDLE